MKKSLIISFCLIVLCSGHQISQARSNRPLSQKSRKSSTERIYKQGLEKKKTKRHKKTHAAQPAVIETTPGMTPLEIEIHKSLSQLMPHFKGLVGFKAIQEKKALNSACARFLQRLEDYDQRAEYQDLIDFITLIKDTSLIQLYNNVAVTNKFKNALPKLPQVTKKLVHENLTPAQRTEFELQNP